MIKPSPVAIDLIKRFEGYRRIAAKLPDGRWTIGHGHTRSAREGAQVSEADAEALLTYDLRAVAAAIDEAVFTPLTQNQIDALASFVFNVGPDAFKRSAVLRRINEGALLDAAFALEIWRKADLNGERIVVDALVRRRAAEKALFLKPQAGWVAAPTPVVEPRPDHGLEVAAPRAPIAETIPSLDDKAAPTPIEQAAVALSARLQAIAPAPSEADGPPEGSEPAPFPTHAEAPPNRPMRPESVPFKAEPAPEPPPVDGAEVLRRRIFGHPEPHPKLELGGLWPLILLGLGGFVVFGGAVFAAFHAKPADGTLSPLGLGLMVVGLIGVMCVASAVYFLLEKLGGREE